MICSYCEECLVRPSCQTMCPDAFWNLLKNHPDELFDITNTQITEMNISHTSEGYFEVNTTIECDYNFMLEMMKSNKDAIAHVESFKNSFTGSTRFKMNIRKRFSYAKEDYKRNE